MRLVASAKRKYRQQTKPKRATPFKNESDTRRQRKDVHSRAQKLAGVIFVERHGHAEGNLGAKNRQQGRQRAKNLERCKVTSDFESRCSTPCQHTRMKKKPQQFKAQPPWHSVFAMTSRKGKKNNDETKQLDLPACRPTPSTRLVCARRSTLIVTQIAVSE